MATQLKYQKILLCTDYSKDAEIAFFHALDQARKYKAKLYIMNVIPAADPCAAAVLEKKLPRTEYKKELDKDEQNMLQELLALKRVYHNRCKETIFHEFIVKVGSPDVEIIRFAEENSIEMIILGTTGCKENRPRTNVKTAANVSKYANGQVITIGNHRR